MSNKAIYGPYSYGKEDEAIGDRPYDLSILAKTNLFNKDELPTAHYLLELGLNPPRYPSLEIAQGSLVQIPTFSWSCAELVPYSTYDMGQADTTFRQALQTTFQSQLVFVPDTQYVTYVVDGKEIKIAFSLTKQDRQRTTPPIYPQLGEAARAAVGGIILSSFTDAEAIADKGIVVGELISTAKGNMVKVEGLAISGQSLIEHNLFLNAYPLLQPDVLYTPRAIDFVMQPGFSDNLSLPGLLWQQINSFH